jgi:hypothetical protein
MGVALVLREERRNLTGKAGFFLANAAAGKRTAAAGLSFSALAHFSYSRF